MRAGQSRPGTHSYSTGKPSDGADSSVEHQNNTSEVKEKDNSNEGRYSSIFDDLQTNQPEQTSASPDAIEATSANDAVTYIRRRKPQKAWSPYTEDNRQAFKHLLETLENVADQDEEVRRLERNLKACSHKFLRRSNPTDLPQSPIMKKSSKRLKPAKETRNPALEPLAHDPWARMLAEPIRQCRASQVRLPVSLLSNWGLTKHPETGEVYLVPSVLADLDSDERVMTREESKWRKRMLELNLEDEYAPIDLADPYDELKDEVAFEHTASAGHDPSETQDADIPSSNSTFRSHSSSGNIRVLLYDNLINLFSLQSLRKTASRASIARYLVPRRMVDDFERAHHYHKNRKNFESRTGIPDTTPATTAATFDLSKLKWKNDIGPRILDILRNRLKIAFVKGASAETTHRLKRVSVVSMSKVMQSSLWHQEQAESGTARVRYHDRQSTETTVERALPPRIYLHLGPLQSPLMLKLISERRTPMLPPLVSKESGSRAQRFPVFPVRAMLGEKHYEDFLGMVRKHGYLGRETVEGMEPGGEEMLLVVRLSVENEDLEVLVRAVWRLWRWGGGRRWMFSEHEEGDEEGWRETVRGLEEGIGREAEREAARKDKTQYQAAGEEVQQERSAVDLGPGEAQDIDEGEKEELYTGSSDEHGFEFTEQDEDGHSGDDASPFKQHDEPLKQ